MFRNLKDILALHEVLLETLEISCPTGDALEIARVFTETDFLEAYGTFCATHDRALQTLQNHKAWLCCWCWVGGGWVTAVVVVVCVCMLVSLCLSVSISVTL